MCDIVVLFQVSSKTTMYKERTFLFGENNNNSYYLLIVTVITFSVLSLTFFVEIV